MVVLMTRWSLLYGGMVKLLDSGILPCNGHIIDSAVIIIFL